MGRRPRRPMWRCASGSASRGAGGTSISTAPRWRGERQPIQRSRIRQNAGERTPAFWRMRLRTPECGRAHPHSGECGYEHQNAGDRTPHSGECGYERQNAGEHTRILANAATNARMRGTHPAFWRMRLRTPECGDAPRILANAATNTRMRGVYGAAPGPSSFCSRSRVCVRSTRHGAIAFAQPPGDLLGRQVLDVAQPSAVWLSSGNVASAARSARARSSRARALLGVVRLTISRSMSWRSPVGPAGASNGDSRWAAFCAQRTCGAGR